MSKYHKLQPIESQVPQATAHYVLMMAWTNDCVVTLYAYNGTLRTMLSSNAGYQSQLRDRVRGVVGHYDKDAKLEDIVEDVEDYIRTYKESLRLLGKAA